MAALSSEEALFMVLDMELKHQSCADLSRLAARGDTAACLPPRQRCCVATAHHSPKRDAKTRAKRAAAPSNGLRCVSGMSEQDHLQALCQNRAQSNKAAHASSTAPPLASIAPLSVDHVTDPVRAEKLSPSQESSAMSNQARVQLSHPSPDHQPPFAPIGASEHVGQLPLFQSHWAPLRSSGDAGSSTAQSSEAAAVAAPVTRTPTRAAAQAGAAKRSAERAVTSDSARKQARLTGFAARMCGTSAYRGVSWHTQTSRWKAQIKVAGKDVNLGRHREEVDAARAYDRAAICARGEKDAKLNFDLEDYADEVAGLVSMPLSDLAASLRGVEARLQAQTSRYHGVRLNKRTQKWEAYIRVAGKHVHLGCYDEEVAAAQAFDQAALVRQAHNLGAMGGKPQLVTNYPPMIYLEFTNQLFSLANPLVNHKVVSFNEGSDNPGYCRLDDKYVQNLLTKCQEQGGSLTAYPSIVS